MKLLRHNASVYDVIRNDTNLFPSVSSVSSGNIIFPMYAKFLTHCIYLYAITLISVCSQLIFEEPESRGFDTRCGHWDFFDLIFPAVLWAWGRLNLQQK